MKKTKTKYKILTITSLIVFVAFFSCSSDDIDLTKPIEEIIVDPDPDPDPDPVVIIDEDTGPYTTCNPDGENATRTSNDLPNPVNVGTIDDRSCYANYK
jgi:hypothetical protein